MEFINRILKVSLIVVVILGLIVFAIVKSLSFDYGNHFSFKNELGIEIDSLQITVCNKKTMIYNLEGNIDAPKKGYPCEVELLLYSKEEIIKLKADSFNCYNCDGNHQYTLTKEKAIYNFLN